jgi:pimeloyl-ACP methyl ester carboxylesterase
MIWMMEKDKKLYFMHLLVTCLMIFAMAGCSDDDKSKTLPDQTDDLPEEVKYETLKEYSLDDLKRMESDFKKAYMTGNGLDFLSFIDRNVSYEGKVQLRVYKVGVTSVHPARSDKKVNLSGLLIVPPLEKGRTYRRVVAPPYTYIMKNEAPTLRVANGNLDPHILFWLIEAFNHGYAVMIPDYPGFGDSFDQCFIPYVEKAPMVRTTVEYVDAALSVLKKEQYDPKGGFVISGYSLGAYVSLQLAREYETNNAHKERSVDLLIVGGSPCNLLQEANLIRASESTPQSHLFPLTLLGYKENGYPHLVPSDYLREPYASGAALWLDGLHGDYERYFTNKTADLFTENFLKNEGQDEVNKILDDNSVKPWKNSCTLIMTHGQDDKTVYYDQASDFALEQERYGGSVTFQKTAGTHTGAGIWFFLKLYTELGNIN